MTFPTGVEGAELPNAGSAWIEHAPIAAYVFRVEGREFVLQTANAAARAHNPAIVSLLGRPMAWLYKDQPQAEADARECVSGGKPIVREMVVRRYDRTQATQRVQLTYVPSPPDHMVLFMVNVAAPDITEKALSESEARYRSLVASLPDAVVLRGADGRVLACNDAAARLFGAETQADVIGKQHVLAPGYRIENEAGEPIGPDDFPSRRVLRTGRAELGQLYALLGDGGCRWVRASAQPIFSADGAITGSVSIYSEITDRIEAQRALRDSSARLDLALGAARMGVWEFDPTRDQGWWSRELGDIFQPAESGDGFERFLANVINADRAELSRRLNALVEAPDGHTFEHDFRFVGRDGVARWARARGRISREAGRPLLSGTLMDVTDVHRMEEELRRAHRLESIGRLAGGVAHDFNNLLAAMMGSLELLDEQCPDEARQDIATVRHCVIRARDLTRKLLAFARKQPLDFRCIDLGALVTEVERLLRRLVGPNIEMEVSAAGPPVFVLADPSLLEQVLVNLVVNARDAMPDGGRLSVRVDRAPRSTGEPDAASIEVTDSGIGMDAETQQQAFDPFFTTKSHGTGLGLASSYGIVKQHGGDIVVESTPGKGTRFRVVLPLSADGGAAAPREATVAPPGALRGTILVVDDDDIVRRTTARLLQSMGYEVIAAAGAAEALERSSAHPGDIDVVLCDVAMPGCDGPSTVAALLARRPALKVILASGYSDGAKYVNVAGALFLQKPYSRAELSARLAELSPPR